MKSLLYQETGVKVCVSGGQIVLDIFTGRVPLICPFCEDLIQAKYGFRLENPGYSYPLDCIFLLAIYWSFFKKFYRHENLFELRVFLNLQWSHFQRPIMSVHKLSPINQWIIEWGIYSLFPWYWRLLAPADVPFDCSLTDRKVANFHPGWRLEDGIGHLQNFEILILKLRKVV